MLSSTSEVDLLWDHSVPICISTNPLLIKQLVAGFSNSISQEEKEQVRRARLESEATKKAPGPAVCPTRLTTHPRGSLWPEEQG